MSLWNNPKKVIGALLSQILAVSVKRLFDNSFTELIWQQQNTQGQFLDDLLVGSGKGLLVKGF